MPQEQAAPDGQPPPLPPQVGKLTVLERIGSGGMANIFLARADGLGGFEKLVVVKQILPHLAQDAEFIQRFFQEARLSATLDHPNIAAVYDVDEADGAFYFSMEYVRGRDLNKVAKRARQLGRQFSFAEAITIIAGLCAGLHHAHTRRDAAGQALGIIHRDVSPSNVLVSYEGATKLSDFGVAKARTGIVTTATGTLRGKLPYMSPEQCRAEGLDRRSDVYAVGAVFWELLTGERLHRSDSEIGLIRQIAEGEAPAVSTRRPDSPPALERIVARSLARQPAERYQSADELRVALEGFAHDERFAISARSVAALMEELFGAEPDFETGSHNVHAARTEDAAAIPGEAPTKTLAPAAEPLGPPLSLTPEPLPAASQNRRGLLGVAAGVLVGIGLGGGGLYLASGANETPQTAPEARVRDKQQPEAQPEPQAPPAAVEPPPPLAPPSEPSKPDAAAAEPEPKPSPRRRPRKRRSPKRNRPASKRAIDLDSPLPPGFGAD